MEINFVIYKNQLDLKILGGQNGRSKRFRGNERVN